MSRTASSGATHRLGRATTFLAPRKAPRAPAEALLRAASDGSERERAAAGALFTILGLDGERTVDVATLRTLSLRGLLATRRPASYSRMRNYIGKFAAPGGADGANAVWFESRNELEHLRDLLLTEDVAVMATQPVRIAWPLSGGESIHYPDILVESEDGRRKLVEVKSVAKLLQPAVLAQFALTSATAAHLGWRFEVRSELPAQRATNQSHVFACRHGTPFDHELLLRWITDSGGSLPLRRCTEWLGGGPGATGVVLSLVAHRLLHVDFDKRLGPDAIVHLLPHPTQEARPWLHQF